MINSWQRPENVALIIHRQSSIELIDEIIVFNNNATISLGHRDPKVKILNSTIDFGLRTRWIMGALARNQLLIFQDDDILLNATTIGGLVTEITRDPERAYGLHGRRPSGDSYNCEDVYGEVDILLTRAVCVHRAIIPRLLEAEADFFLRVGVYPTATEFPADDLFFSYCVMAYFKRHNMALRLPYENLPDHNALSLRCGPDYLSLRSRLMQQCKNFFRASACNSFYE